MRVGIGVITYKRQKTLKLCNEKIWEFTPQLDDGSYSYIVEDDSIQRMGIAFRSNQILKRFRERECEYGFIFNDDCFPIKPGWAEFFIEAHKASGQHHFLYLKETPTIKCIDTHSNPETRQDYKFSIRQILSYNNCGGCFMFLTKEVIEKVGAFDETFGLYGFEHADYSDRIHMAGLTPMGKYLCPAGASEYIYAMDYDYHLPFNKQVDHKPSMPVTEVVKLLQSSQQTYYNKQKTIFLPL